MENQEVNRIKYQVIAGGGKWVGIQEVVPPGPDLVLFNSETTQTTLALPVNECTAERVREKIIASDQAFLNRRISVKRSVLVHLSDKLADMRDEIQNLLGEK